jgi:Domain of unknown function (DUF4342)
MRGLPARDIACRAIHAEIETMSLTALHGRESSRPEPEAPMDPQPTRIQEFTIDGDQLLATVKELVHEGNVRRLTIKSEEGRTLLEVPLTIGVIGAALLPVFAAIGALAALATRCTIVVEREAQTPVAAPPEPVTADTI